MSQEKNICNKVSKIRVHDIRLINVQIMRIILVQTRLCLPCISAMKKLDFFSCSAVEKTKLLPCEKVVAKSAEQLRYFC